MPARLQIGELARASGTKVETIRYYERIGLLPAPDRTGGNYRAYDEPHVRRLGFIRKARALGFTVEQVRALLALVDQPERDCAEVDRIARAHLAEVEQKIADLQALRQELADIVGRCRAGTVASCRIVESLTVQTPTRLSSGAAT